MINCESEKNCSNCPVEDECNPSRLIERLQKRMGDGDIITIWKKEYQIAEDGNTPTNYSSLPH